MYRTKWLSTVAVLAALIVPVTVNTARADIIYTLGESNTAGMGPGPFGFVDLHRIDSTHVEFTFYGNHPAVGYQYSFGEMGLNLSTTGFTNLAAQVTATTPTFTVAPGQSSPNSFALSFSGNMDGFGNFDFHQTPSPNGASDALVKADFTITRSVGTWATEASVLALNNKSNVASQHFFWDAGGPHEMSAYNNDTSSISCIPGSTCPTINPTQLPGGVPEPASILIFGTSAMGLAWARKSGRKVSGR
jgi:PEP-CTERM motif